MLTEIIYNHVSTARGALSSWSCRSCFY